VEVNSTPSPAAPAAPDSPPPAGAGTADGAHRAGPREPRSPLLASALSFVFPGLGQLYLGRRRSAVAFAVPAVAAVVWAALQLSQGFVYFAVSMLDDSYALTVMIVAAAVTAWRLASIAHPFLVVRPRRVRFRAAASLAMLFILTVGMGDIVFSNAYDAYSASQEISANNFADATDPPDLGTPPATFSGTPDPYASPSSTPTDWPIDDPTDSPEPTLSPGQTCPPSYSLAGPGALLGLSRAAAPAAPTPDRIALPASTATDGLLPSESPTLGPTPTPTPTPATPGPDVSVTPTSSPTPPTPSPSPTANPDRLTILLVGVDYITGRNHASTDTLMLVSVDLKTRAVAMVSVPRDTANFPFYWGGQAPVTFKINTLAKAVAAGRFGSPDSPMVTLANEVGWLVGVNVNYYAAIDMTGFKQLVDVVGGVDLNNPTLLNDPFTCTRVPAGMVHLNGSQALRYVRSRESTNDYWRASRQQLVMMALRKKLATPAILPKLGSLLAVAGKSIATNFPLKTAKDYVDTAEHISSISHCVLASPYNYHPDSSTTGGSWTSRLKLYKIANLSVSLFGTDSRYYGQPGVVPTPCESRY
jgi:LCP family protein required for cell wall assembly